MKTLMAEAEKNVMTPVEVEDALQSTPSLVRRHGIQFNDGHRLISIPQYFCEDIANSIYKTLEEMAENPKINSKGVWKMPPPCAAERGHAARINAMHRGVVQGITGIQDEHKRDLKNSDLLEHRATAYQKVGELLQENGGLKQQTKQFKTVYREFNNLLCHIGYEGSVDADSRYVLDAMQALNGVDGGVYGEQFASKNVGSIPTPATEKRIEKSKPVRNAWSIAMESLENENATLRAALNEQRVKT